MPAFGPCRRACGCAGLFFLPPDSAVLPVFAALLFAPSFFPSSVFLPVFRLSSRLPFFSCRPAFPTARISHCPCFSQPAAPQLCRFVLSRLYSVWFFFCHFLFFRSSSIACRLLSIARCAVHRSSPAVCCPSPVVHPLPPVVRRPLRRPSFIARRLLAVARTPSPVPPRLFPLPFGPDHGFCIRGIPACVSSGAACRVVPQRVPSVGLSAKMRPPSVPWSPRRF